ncbi:MAG: S-layer homology domain-containing protein [Actinomycetota bacterium]
MTVFVQPTASLAETLGLPVVPLPLRETTAAALQTQRVEPGAMAFDIDEWLAAAPRDESTTTVLSRWVGGLGYAAAIEHLDHGRPDLAAEVLRCAIRRLPDDPSLRANLGIALWDHGLRYDGLAQLVLATRQYDDANQLSVYLWVLTARTLSEAGRHADALELLDQIAALDPKLPMFWDLRDSIAARIGPPEPQPKVRPAPAAPAPAAIPSVAPAQPAERSGGRRRGGLLVGLVVAVLAGLGGGYLLFGSGDDPALPTAGESEPSTTTAPSVTTTTPPTTTQATTTSTTTTTTLSTVAVPAVSGGERSASVADLESAGFVVAVVEQESYTDAVGSVLASDPVGGTALEPGSTVTLTVATRPVECNDRPDALDPAPFTDTGSLNDEARRALDWAVAIGLVGAGDTFNPSAATDRGTAVALLWRYICRPDPGPAPTTFDDFDAGAFYADAVAWSVNNGVLGGTSASTLGATTPISRAAFVTVVWRAIGSPESDTSLGFADVPDDAFFRPAVQWAVGAGLIGGTSPTTFSPGDDVSRTIAIVILDRVERLVDPLVAGPTES